MFTGIIRHVGQVRSISPSKGGRRLHVDIGPIAEGLGLGDSVAVSGACLTASQISGPVAVFDVVAETVERTTLGDLKAGSPVNLEPAMSLGGRLDGHLVQGHVDGIAEIVDIRRGDRWDVTFRAGAEVVGELVTKGSVTVDGVSLTVAGAEADTFRVALIPTTLAETTLAGLAVGDRVNIETDVIGKYVRRFLQQLLADGGASGGGLSLEALRDAGFC